MRYVLNYEHAPQTFEDSRAIRGSGRVNTRIQYSKGTIQTLGIAS